MVVKTIESEAYKNIAKNENVIAMEASVDRNKGGVYPYYMGVSVRTDKQTYLFACSNAECTSVKNEGTTYSIYQDEKPKLPLK